MRDDKSLIVTEKVNIYQREDNSTEIRFLVPQTIQSNDLNMFLCVFKYELPNGEKCCDMPVKQQELYNGFIDYRLTVSSRMTLRAGHIRGYLSFLTTIKDEETQSQKPFVIHSGKVYIEIHECRDIYVGCANLQAVDNQILKLQSMIDNLADYQSAIDEMKADDIEIIDDQIWLMSNGQKIGTPIPYTVGDAATEEMVRRVLGETVLLGGDADDFSE